MDLITNSNFLFYVAAYLIGSIPFGLLLAKFFAGVDVKSAGSKSIGATNVLRVVKETNPSLAKKLGAATVLLDALKGTLVLLVGMSMGYSESALWMAAVLAVLGHCYSIYLGLEGGKGVATGLGVTAVMLPIETLIALVTWFVVGKLLKISSLSSLIALVILFVSSFYISPDITHTPIALITFFIFYKHIPNIERLIRGEEKKVI